MAVTTIKSYNSDLQAEVTADHELKVAGTFTASNDSIGVNGAPAPGSSTQVGGVDPNGNLRPIELDSSGQLKVAGLPVFATQEVKVLFNEVSAIAIGIETLVNSYTAPVGKIAYLLTIQASGENRGQYNIYLNGALLDKKYSNVTQLEADFDYKTGASSVPGMIIPVGQAVDIKVINAGASSANYAGRFLILEVTQ